MDRTVASQTWDALANAIDEIYNRNASQLSFEELYRNAYNLVLHKHGTLLYEGVTDKLNAHLSETARRLAGVADPSLLEEIATTWAEHQVRAKGSTNRIKNRNVFGCLPGLSWVKWPWYMVCCSFMSCSVQFLIFLLPLCRPLSFVCHQHNFIVLSLY